MKKSNLIFIMSLIFALPALANVELPEDELAKESVLPKFDNSVSVKNKNVSLTKKIEIVPYVGWNFTEAIYNQMKVGAILGYHVNDDHAFSVNLGSWTTGLSQYGEQLRAQQGLLFERAPRPSFSVSGNWEVTAYYGKISITKQGVGNITLYPIVGVGMTTFTHKTFFNMNGGLGMKLYFSKNLALRTDLRLQYAQQTEPFLLGKMQSGQTVPQASEFTEKWVMGTIVDVGLAILF
jgi:outer membrane beta-barrel protein